MTDGSPSVLDCNLIKGNEYGIYIQTSRTSNIEGNNFEENRYPIWIGGDSPVLKNNKSQNNTNLFNSIILAGTVSRDSTWYKNPLPYLIGRPRNGSQILVAMGTTLRIEPGVIVEFGDRGSMEIEGTLLAGSSEEETVVLTSYNNQAAWNKIHFYSQSINSVIKNVEINGGGYDNWFNKGEVIVENSFRLSGIPGYFLELQARSEICC